MWDELKQKYYRPDYIAITGTLIGLISLFFGFLSVKPNRLAEGVSLGIVASSNSLILFVFILIWLVCFILAFVGKARWQPVAMGSFANVLLFMYFILVGSVSGSIILTEFLETRISPNIGFWMAILAIYFVIFASRRKLMDAPLLCSLFSWMGLIFFLLLLVIGYFDNLSVMIEFAGQKARFFQELLHHLYLIGISIIFGSLFGIFIGFWATRNRIAEQIIFFIVNITQTIPSLALFGLLIAPLSIISLAYPSLRDFGIRGIGDTPAIIALIVYSLLPIAKNTYTGLVNIDGNILDAGQGMGMSETQKFTKIEISLAAPLIVEGIRIASVQSVGLVAVAALIGAGGLGWFVFQGLGQAAPDLILLGTIPLIILALLIDWVMRTVSMLATPKGVTEVRS